MVDLESIARIPGIVSDFEAGAVVLFLELHYFLGKSNVGGLKDGKSGVKFAWDILTKVDLRDLKRFNYIPLDEEMLDKYGLRKYFKPLKLHEYPIYAKN